MKTMKRALMATYAVLLPAVAMTSATALVHPLQAQQERTECRCVDADGAALDNCSCFRTPQIEGLLTRYGIAQQRPRLGVSVDQGQSARYDAEGALVTDVLRDGPADQAGIRAGDVILSLDGQSLTESIGADRERTFDLDGSAPVQRLLALAGELQPSQAVEIEFVRDGDRERTTLEAQDLSDRWGETLVAAAPTWDAERFHHQMRRLAEGIRDQRMLFEAPDRELMMRREARDRRGVRVFGGDPSLFRGSRLDQGLEMVELNPGLGSYFGTDSGVLIIDVHEASDLGLEAGDVILRVGDRAVEGPDRLRRIVSSYGSDEEIRFHLLRNGDEITVTGRMDG